MNLTRSSTRKWVGSILVAAVGVVLLWWTWLRWLNPLIDFGRELYIPWQLTEGKVLYEDLAYFNGPFSPYLNNLVFALLGVSLRSILLMNLAILIAVVAILYFLLERHSDHFTATVGCVFFLVVFAFADLTGTGNYNYMAPYSHEATHGLALLLASLLLFELYLDRRSPRILLGIGLLLGLVFLTKLEFFVAIGPLTAVGVGLSAATHHRSLRSMTKELAVLGGAAVVPPALAFSLLWISGSAATAIKGVLGPWPYAMMSELRNMTFYKAGMGVLDVRHSFRIILLWLVFYFLAFAPAVLISWRLSPTSKWRYPVTLALGLWTGFLTYLVVSAVGPEDLFRPAPFLLVGFSGYLLFKIARRWKEGVPDRLIVELVAVGCSLILLFKIVLRARFSHYGFSLAVPAAMLFMVVLLHRLPSLVERGGGYGRSVRAVALVFLSLITLAYLVVTAQSINERNLPIGEGGDRFKFDLSGIGGAVFNSTLEELTSEVKPGETLTVLPEGVMMNYLLRIENPTPFVNFMPPEFIMFGDEQIVRAFAARSPDLILMTNRGTKEYGYVGFGLGFGEELVRWVGRNYYPEKKIEESFLQDGEMVSRIVHFLRPRSRLKTQDLEQTPGEVELKQD